MPCRMSKSVCRQKRVTTTDASSTVFSCTFTNVQTVIQLQDTEICLQPPPSPREPWMLYNPPQPTPGHDGALKKKKKKESLTGYNQSHCPVLDFSFLFIQTHCQQIYTWQKCRIVATKSSLSPKKYCLFGAKMATYEINHCHSGYNDC